jgi:predicted DNA-binding protein
MALEARMEIRMPAHMRKQVEAVAEDRGWSAAMYAREAMRLALRDDLPELEGRRHAREAAEG